ncbi:PP2C family protein-serine/threonine phosphatase [Aquipuribacter hungaricus]|uniref:PP2C family protein-serine/threonine phosphatase n=1 Tax=Aquipuribacter hungaricus TaxID=545624 RepID=A0ABV7WHJ7_9MICO
MPDPVETSPLTRLSGGLLPLLDAAMPGNITAVLRRFLVEHAGASDAGILLADYELSQLRRLSPRPGETEKVPVTGSIEGQCFVAQSLLVDPGRTGRTALDRPGGPAGGAAGADETLVLVPLSLRAERLGVLQVAFQGPVSAGLLRGLQEVALATTYTLVVCGSFSDVVEVTRRAEPLTLAAEMQWNLQPLRAFSAPGFSVAGQLIPSYEVGGDTYDYDVAADHLDLSSLDAMGHGLGASVLAALATAVMRNTRRGGGGPAEQVTRADRALLAHFGGAQFVTVLAMRLGLRSGVLELVNAGHPAPWLIRDGRAAQVTLDPRLPAGMFEATDYVVEHLQLQAGDRLVVVTDGVLEAGAPGEELGEDRLAGLLLASADLTPHQCVAEVLHTVRAYAPRLHDDATVVCLDWDGPSGSSVVTG